jgi:type VI protein secretion system component Hcp
LRYQAGAPTLYADAAQGTAIGPVDLWFRANAGGVPSVVLKVTLTGATVSSVVDTGVAGSTPTLALTLGSARLDVSYSPLRADGSLGPATTAFWDSATNTGSSFAAPNLDFTIGAPRPTAQEVTSFRAPSETGVGLFSDASITAPMSAAILQDMIAAASHTVVPSGSVQLFKAAADGSVRLYGSYGFKNAAIHSVSFTGPTAATVGFGANGYTWSVGTETTTFP